MRQTLFTPTYNRAGTLPRLYDSIKQQSFKDFVWLIIDDGSSDNTQQVVDSFINENKVQIKYVYKENGGKYTAQKLAYQLAETPYITEIDSDDTLLPNALEDFENAWIDIEKEASDIAKVSMFVVDEEGQLVGYGKYDLKVNKDFDSCWQDYVLKRHIHKELVSSLSVNKFVECVKYENYIWDNREPQKFLSEGIIWALIGRKYKTRLLMKAGRKYYYDASNSIMRGKQNYFDNLANCVYFVNDNIDYFFYNPQYFIGQEKSLISNWFKTSIPLTELFRHIKGYKHRLLFLISIIPFSIFFVYKKI